MTHVEFQRRLRETIRSRKLTQAQAAALLDVSASLLEAWLAAPEKAWSRRPNRFEQHGIIIELVAADLRAHKAIVAQTDWNSVDWTQPTSALSAQLNVPISTISTRRREYAPETMHAGRTFRINRVTRWEKIDWSLSNPELAARYNCSHQTVRTQRLIHAPHTYTGRTLANAATDWAQMDWTRSNKEIAAELGIHEGSVKRQRTRHQKRKV